MRTERRSLNEVEILNLAVDPAGAKQGSLASFRFGEMDEDPGHLGTDLIWLGGDLSAEYWQGEEAVQYGCSDGVHWSCDDQLLMMSMEWNVPGDVDLSEPTRDIYRRMVRFSRESDYPWLLRMWNFVPQINRGKGDGERYRRFCLGRKLALEDLNFRDIDLCAGTAVGTNGNRLLIHMLCARRPGIPVENPRQVSAYKYPRIYGPRSPAFARATAVELSDDEYGLFVSGTASIVGHETIHPGELMPQVDQTIQNLQTLLGEAATRLDKPGLARFNSNTVLRVYLRVANHWHEVEQRVRDTWPDIRLAGMKADICRSDLMVEMEAFHRG